MPSKTELRVATGRRTMIVIMALAAILGSLAFGLAPTTRAAPGATSAVAATCLGPAYTSPNSVLIPIPQPNGPLSLISAGERLGSSVEVQQVSPGPGAPPPKSLVLTLPSMYATFHLSSGSTVRLTYAPQNLTLGAHGWSPALTRSVKVTSGGSFSTGSATLSSDWLAIQAPATYGSVAVQFQWRWWLQAAIGGAPHNGAWNQPITASTTAEQPTTFDPAPLVTVAAAAPVSQSANATYWIDLQGNVSGTSFRLVVETPTGHEVVSSCTASTSGAAAYNDTARLQYANGTPLPKGAYLVHIHNEGGAIVAFAKVDVS